MHKFNKAAKTYLEHNRLQRYSFAVIQDMLPKKAFTVLDLGCGPGAHLLDLQKQYPKSLVIGCDNSQAMLKIAQTNNNYLIAADANKLPFVPNCFDLITSNMLIQWLPDLSKTFADIWNITKYNGEFIAATLGKDSLKEARQALASIDRQNNINDFFDMHELGDLLQQQKWQEIYTAREVISLEFNSAYDVFSNLRLTGSNTKTNNSATNKYLSKKDWQTCLDNYPKTNGKYLATYEIITLRAKKLLPKNQIDPKQIQRI